MQTRCPNCGNDGSEQCWCWTSDPEERPAVRVPFQPSSKVQEGLQFPIVREVSSSSSDSTYKVTLYDATGYGTCQCKGFSYRNICKHLKAIRGEILGTTRIRQDLSH